MWFSLADQTAYFLWSLALGAAIGALYDIVRAVRMLTRAGSVHVLLSDIIFFAACGVITSLFALPFNKGDVRAFIIFGEAVGFLSYRFTLGSVMGKFYSHFTGILRKFIQKINKFLEFFFDLLLKMTLALLYNIKELIDKSLSRAARMYRERRIAARTERPTAERKHKERANEQKKRKNPKAGNRRKDRRQRKKRSRR